MLTRGKPEAQLTPSFFGSTTGVDVTASGLGWPRPDDVRQQFGPRCQGITGLSNRPFWSRPSTIVADRRVGVGKPKSQDY